METNTTKFKEYLARELKDVQWQSSNTQKILFWITLPTFIITGILAFVLLINTTNGDLTFSMILGIISIVTLVIMIVAISIWVSNRRKNKRLLLTKIPNNVYSKYYEYTYPNNVLKFEGLRNSDRFSGYKGMLFEINGENLWWDIKEHTELRYYTVSDGKGGTTTRSYTVYILDYLFRLKTERLKNYEPITLTTNSKLKKMFNEKNNDREFFSASITFNQKFRVLGKNQLQMTKLFDPSVVQFLDEANPNMYKLYKSHPIKIDDGFAYTQWNSGDRQSPWGANLNAFEYLKITKENYVNEITNRISNDFDQFFKVLYLFRPFDFYRIYQKKN